MLDDYKSEQPIIYKILVNSIKKNKFSHAYLFELNGYSKGFDIALAFAKFLLCPFNYSCDKKCSNCHQCKNIDNNNFLEFKVIESEGQWIKKEQLETLQQDFMKKSLLGNKKVYIINGAEKLNVSASNALLKFLEEPPDGVIAILISNNIHQLLNTIVSRCQVLSLKKEISKNYNLTSIEQIGKYLFSNLDTYNNFINIEGKRYIDEIIDYLNFLDKYKCETLIIRNKQFIEVFNDRKKVKIAFDLFVLYYKDILNYLLGLNLEYFYDYKCSIVDFSKSHNASELSKKIKTIVDLSIDIKYNLNSNLLLDKLVILLSEE